MKITKEQLSKAFTLWEDDYRRDPEKFMDDQARKSKKSQSLGEMRAETLLEYLNK